MQGRYEGTSNMILNTFASVMLVRLQKHAMIDDLVIWMMVACGVMVCCNHLAFNIGMA